MARLEIAAPQRAPPLLPSARPTRALLPPASRTRASCAPPES